MRAFSLIETMVVVAIIGIAAALAVPALLPEIHKAQLDGDAESVANFLARARAEAMFSKRCVRVHLGATSVAAVATTTSQTLTAEKLNSFDCDAPFPVPAAELIDSAQPAWVKIDELKASTSKITFSVAAADNATSPGCLKAGCGFVGATQEFRFRPNGRIYTTATPPAALADDGIITVRHDQIVTNNEFGAGPRARRSVLVQRNGLICVFNRGVMLPAPVATPPTLCP